MIRSRPKPPATPPLPWHELVIAFKRGLIERALAEARGNRTRAARALGLQRTYLLRLIRELGVTAPRPLLGAPRAPVADIAT